MSTLSKVVPAVEPSQAMDRPKDVEGVWYRFAKNQSPWEDDVLPSGNKIVWHRPLRQGGGYEGFGTFQTKNKAIADELKAYSINRPERRIFGQE